MKTALVLGGTRFFGVKLVESLLNKGIQVTVATRGNTNDPFGDKVDRIQFDRNDKESFTKSFEGNTWDVVFDQICYSCQDANDAIEVFKGKTNRYIFTSTLSVYDDSDRALVESDFNPYTFEITLNERTEVSYQEGKRQAEAVFFKKAPFSMAAVRFPIVLGENDYTERMVFYIRKVFNEEVIYLQSLDAAMGFISEGEAGNFLSWLSMTDFEGPINACTNGTVTLREFITYIEKATGKKAKVEITHEESKLTPYAISSSWYMSNEKAKNLGYKFDELKQWLPELIRKSC